MNEMYAEAGVKCEKTSADLAKIAIIAVAFIASVVLSVAISPLFFVVAIGVGAFAIYKAGQFNYEYEYIFCDGQLDIDKIMGNVKRKQMLRVDFDQCEVIAIEGSQALDTWNNRKLKEYDYTSHTKNKKPYVIIAHKDTDLVRILFEPNDAMVQCMRDKSRRLVHVQ